MFSVKNNSVSHLEDEVKCMSTQKCIIPVITLSAGKKSDSSFIKFHLGLSLKCYVRELVLIAVLFFNLTFP